MKMYDPTLLQPVSTMLHCVICIAGAGEGGREGGRRGREGGRRMLANNIISLDI